MITFQAVQKNGEVRLQWSTAREHNSDYFVVERSSDARNFTEIGRVTAAGESKTITEYEFSDARPNQGIAYYRLNQVDQDGQAVYSKIVSCDAKISPDNQVFTLYPNPSTGQNIFLLSDFVGKAQIQVFNHFGKLMSIQQVNATGSPIALQQTGDLPQGVYIVKLSTPGKEYQQKLVIR
jgi:hypothetical protein